MRNELHIRYDVESMEAGNRVAMETELLRVLKKYGWKFSASGADIALFRANDVRERDIVMDRI